MKDGLMYNMVNFRCKLKNNNIKYYERIISNIEFDYEIASINPASNTLKPLVRATEKSGVNLP